MKTAVRRPIGYNKSRNTSQCVKEKETTRGKKIKKAQHTPVSAVHNNTVPQRVTQEEELE